MVYWIYKHESGVVEIYERDCKRQLERCIHSSFNDDSGWYPWDSDTIVEERVLYRSMVRQIRKADLNHELFLESI